MKKCNLCGVILDDDATFCTACGSSDLSVQKGFGGSGAQNAEKPDNTEYTVLSENQDNAAIPAQPDLENGNVIAGVVGAFLFSLIGGALYFVVYQFGFIAGICGLVTFVLANFGYSLFAKGNKNTAIGIAVSIIMTLIMIFIAEYLSLSYEIFKAAKEAGTQVQISFFEAVKITPEFLEDPEVRGAVAKDLVFAYALGIIASIGNIVNIVKSKKQSKKS